jgi:hypothetical protein
MRRDVGRDVLMSRSRLVGLGLACLPLTSCFAVTDLDRFEKNSGKYVDLTLTVRGMKSHVNELFEYRVVDSENIIQSRGIALPLGGVDATFFAPKAIPTDKPVRVDFFADHNNSKGYDSTPTDAIDHAWRIGVDLAGVGKDGAVITFDHNTSFVFINDPGGPPREIGTTATVRLRSGSARSGKRIQVRIADAFTGRVVALYRYPLLDKNELDMVVPGMVETGNTYIVELTADDPVAGLGSLEAWRVQRDSGPQGLDVTFDLATSDALKVGDAPRP